MAVPGAVIDIVATQILVDAKAAMQSLRAFDAALTSSAQRVTTLKEIVRSLASQMGGDTKGAFQKLSAAWKSIGGDSAALNRTAKDFGMSLEQAGNKGQSAFGKIGHGIDVIRIAMGVLVSMLISQVIAGFTQFFTSSIKNATELEDSLYRLRNVEIELSKAGKEISLKGLEEGIKGIREQFKIFSQEDVAGLVGKVAISTKDLNYSQEQILKLAESIAVLNIRSTEAEDLNATAAKVITALLSGTTKGISNLGLQMSDLTIQTEAVKEGFLKAGESVDNLTKTEKDLVKYNIVIKSAGGEILTLNEYLATNSAKLKENKSAWEDLKTTIGQGFANAIPNLTGFFTTIQKSIEVGGIGKLFNEAIKGQEGIKRFGLENQIIMAKLSLGIALTQKQYDYLKKTLSSLSSEEILKIFPDPSIIKDRFTRELVQSIVTIKETATAASPLIGGDAVDPAALEALSKLDEKLKDIAADAENAKEDLAQSLKQKGEDINVKFTQKGQDIDKEYVQKGIDAATDLNQKVQDINQDALDNIEDAKRKARENEQHEEEQLLQKLKELRQRFLMDLEDALHARDARQVLRLLKEYEFNKQNILDNAKLDEDARKDKLDEELRNIEIERKRRIETAQIEYQRKLADLAIAKKRELEQLDLWKAREEADLKVWYDRELADIDKHAQDKIEKLVEGYVQEFGIHQEYQAKIQALILKYFGENKSIMDGMAVYMAGLMAQMQAMVSAVSTVPILSAAASPSGTNIRGINLSGSGSLHSGGGHRKAEGGSVIATRPTTAVFGERGAELATFTPLGRTGRDVNKLFGNTSAVGGGVNGQIMVTVDLSEGLEGKVVNKAMDSVAEIMAKVNRTKVK